VEEKATIHDTVLEGIEIVNPIRFDLEMADWRIKTVLDHQSLVGEQYRFLRAKLAAMQKQRGIKTILVTSSTALEGKTFTACCLAGILAQEPSKRVLLVDADLRRPRAGRNLGLDETVVPGGFSQMLRDEAGLKDSLLRCSNLDFYFLPSGTTVENPSELLSSPNLERQVKHMAFLFDWIVMDCPPALALADVARLAPLCDTVLLVVWADKTPVKMINQAIQMIGREQICGIVLNRARDSSSYYYYYRYYSNNGGRRRKEAPPQIARQ
jgi:capsular exopolysaccharide synthesis family protein